MLCKPVNKIKIMYLFESKIDQYLAVEQRETKGEKTNESKIANLHGMYKNEKEKDYKKEYGKSQYEATDDDMKYIYFPCFHFY